jgi:hypothetical protein
MNLQTAVIWLVDVVIVATLIEFFVLRTLYAKRGVGVAPKDFALNMLSGVCLMLALRVALSGGSSVLILITLAAAGLLHGADIRRRWQR